MEEVAGGFRRLHSEKLHNYTLQILLGWSNHGGWYGRGM